MSSPTQLLILRELKCPVCLEYMTPPITQCATGHNICTICRLRMKHCPTCRNQLPWIRNFTLENLAQAIDYPCVNKMAGCTQSFPLYSIKRHEAQCPYRNHECPYHKISKEDCDWSGSLVEMKNHVKEMHDSPGDNVELTGPLRTVLRDISEISSFRQVIFTLNEIFYVIWELRNNTFYCAAFHIGQKENSCKYKYRFRISKKKGAESISYCLKTHSFMDDVDGLIERGECVAIRYNCVQKFIKNSVLPFEIHIFNNDLNKHEKNEFYFISGNCNESYDKDAGENGITDEVDSN
jgi:E3 ubiquitin-protein ligase SIAH1